MPGSTLFWMHRTSDTTTLGHRPAARRMTVYVGIQPDKLAESRVIVNLFFSQVVNQNTRVLPRNDRGLKHQCLLLMDEFTSIGRVDIIATAVAYMAGYNLRLLPIIQSMAQLDATYGKDVARTLVTNQRCRSSTHLASSRTPTTIPRCWATPPGAGPRSPAAAAARSRARRRRNVAR